MRWIIGDRDRFDGRRRLFQCPSQSSENTCGECICGALVIELLVLGNISEVCSHMVAELMSKCKHHCCITIRSSVQTGNVINIEENEPPLILVVVNCGHIVNGTCLQFRQVVRAK
jgi:hypothetical protein